MTRIPSRGLGRNTLFSRLESYKDGDMPWRDGRTWAYVYDPGHEAESVIKEAFSLYLQENGLDPTVFPSTLRLENEVIAMAANHLQGDEESVGSFTSGGTESIILAVKAARDRARALRPEVHSPEVILPATAHASFQKACHYLCLKAVVVPVDPETFHADVEEVRKAITDQTVMFVGSAISYAHGVVDPIRELGQLALEKDLWLHVDGCMGGFLLPYFRRLGADVPDFELHVPGVSSISMDFHKYAFAAKGASVVLYRSKELRRYQMYACSNWTGYTVINPTVQSTKSAGPLAAAWAVLNFIGDAGYLEIARQVMDATRRIAQGVDEIPELRLLGWPQMNLLCFTSDEVSVFHVADEMKQRGWYVQPQLGYGDSKENIHLSINPASARWVDSMLADLRECVEKAKQLPSGELSARIREAFRDDTPVTPEVFAGMLGMAGVEGTALPERMAEINEVLNALPVRMREQLLVEYLNELYQPENKG